MTIADDIGPEIQPAEESVAGSETVDLSKIRYAPTEVPSATPGASAHKEASMLAHEAEQFKKELGLLGIPFGGRSEKPGNISALVICVSLALIFIIYAAERIISVKFGDSVSSFDFDRIFGALTSIITLVLGYLFGSNERSGK
ncbi:hypothetical protein [Terrihabitans sp. B22-R8]|uniref:hypothetical protein n=1 Tax=Terrihabitans sp. B22-R8 TaxID=3425128 RepID=UPI00403C71DC